MESSAAPGSPSRLCPFRLPRPLLALAEETEASAAEAEPLFSGFHISVVVVVVVVVDILVNFAVILLREMSIGNVL